MERNEELVSKRRLVGLQPRVAVEPGRQAEVTEIDLSAAVGVRQRQSDGQAPLGHDADVLGRWVQTQHRSLV